MVLLLLQIPELQSLPSLTSLESTMPTVTETAGPWVGPAYWLNALVRSLTHPIRIGIAARVLLEISFRSPLFLRKKPGLNERKRMASDVSYVSEHDGKAW